jgi:hypothetical protein
MFQYAAGRALSLSTHQIQNLDLNDFTGYQLHNGFELERVFNIDKVVKSTSSNIQELLSWRANSFAKKILRRSHFAKLRGQSFIVEPYFNYWPNFFELKQDCYLYGYWQSERYFKDFADIIRQDFAFKIPLDERNKKVVLEMTNTQSVSLHVRRGDYVNDPKNSNIMHICSLEYYRQAINYIVKRIEQPVFYIFSDDIAWVKEHLSIEFPCVYIDHNSGSESYRDMQLMSLCKHHVIANSSFSWWGAWLNANPEKTVIAPREWFVNKNNVDDLIPHNWIKI